jgi:hypothetical protein
MADLLNPSPGFPGMGQPPQVSRHIAAHEYQAHGNDAHGDDVLKTKKINGKGQK